MTIHRDSGQSSAGRCPARSSRPPARQSSAPPRICEHTFPCSITSPKSGSRLRSDHSTTIERYILVHRFKRWYREAFEFGHNRVGGFGPDEGLWIGTVLGDISIYGRLQVGDRAKDAAAAALVGGIVIQR